MKKEMTYSVVRKVDPRNPELTLGYYAKAVSTAHADLRQIGFRISRKCSLTRAEVESVVVALQDEITDSLLRGERVSITGLGTFYLSVSSRKAATPEAFGHAHITGCKLKFTQSKAFGRRLALPLLTGPKHRRNRP